MEYVIWCDESIKKGKFYSNFYGGVLVRSRDVAYVNRRIADKMAELNFNNEVKWQRVTGNYLNKYMELMDTFFELINNGKIKCRIMFTKNAFKPLNLNETHLQDEFFILYYQFFQHAFGLAFSNPSERPVYLRVYFDALPDKIERNNRFKEFIKGLERKPAFQRARIKFRKDQIAEVDSAKHPVMQCLDVVLGAMAFRLNDMHKEKPPGATRRGKRTIAKEKLYKHLHKHICEQKTNFNIGVSTGNHEVDSLWKDAYRHWLFKPYDVEEDKSGHKKSSVPPT